MLVVDPMKRITIREIREHPWFEAQLPRYLAVPPPDTAQQVKKVQLAVCTTSYTITGSTSDIIVIFWVLAVKCSPSMVGP
jgi:hypothetical protein